MPRALLFLLLSLALPTEALAQPQWRTIRSPNFLVFGDAGEASLQDVVTRLEQFHTVLGRVLNITLSTPVPTVLIVFGSRSALEPFAPRYGGRPVQAAGFFTGGRDVNYITLTLDGGTAGLRVAFHEYTHLIVHNWMSSVPAWLDEGLAEYYSTFALENDGKAAQIGSPIPHHLQLLRERFMPLTDLLAVDRRSPLYNEGDDRSVFYAESWALVHYLLMDSKKGDFQINRYLSASAGGEPIDRAIQQAFHMPPAALEKRLREYVNRSTHLSAPYRFRDRVGAAQATGRPLTDAETEAWLGDLLLHTNRLEEARPRLEHALLLDPDVARAHMSLGMLALRQGRSEEAWPRLQRAVALDPTNFLPYFSYALALLSFRPGETPLSMDIEPLSAARAALIKATELNPESTDALSWLGYADLAAGAHLDEARAALTRATKLAPGRLDYALRLAEICVRLQDYSDARRLLTPLATTSDELGIGERARSLLQALDALQRGGSATRSKGGRHQEAATVVPVVVLVVAGGGCGCGVAG